jgi:hypothetical protein
MIGHGLRSTYIQQRSPLFERKYFESLSVVGQNGKQQFSFPEWSVHTSHQPGADEFLVTDGKS